MPIIYNKDSTIEIPDKFYNHVINKLTYLIKAWNNLAAIVIVKEKTMNEICPPEESLSPNCVKEIMLFLRNEIAEEFFLERLSDKLSRCKLTYNVVACYKNRKIYICPERIWKFKNPEYVFKFVLIHELTHAYLDFPGHKHSLNSFPDYYKVIEESLCNTIAYYHIKNRSKLLDFLNSQPAEYQGYVFWLKQPKNSLPFILDLWKNNEIPIFSLGKEDVSYVNFIRYVFFKRKVKSYIRYLQFAPLVPLFLELNISSSIVYEYIREYLENNNKRPLISLIGLAILGSI